MYASVSTSPVLQSWTTHGASPVASHEISVDFMAGDTLVSASMAKPGGGMRWRLGIVCAVLVLSAAGPAAAAPPTFSGPAPFDAGPSPFSVAAADFDLDGKPDLVTANDGSFGDGGVTALRNLTAAGGATPIFSAPRRATRAATRAS